jgi:hypothetical protein
VEIIVRKLIVFNSMTLDGYFADAHGEMRWAHNATPDAGVRQRECAVVLRASPVKQGTGAAF